MAAGHIAPVESILAAWLPLIDPAYDKTISGVRLIEYARSNRALFGRWNHLGT